MLGEYMHSAAFVDDAISQLFDGLRAENMLRDTMVVMYGDHAALLHSSPRERASYSPPSRTLPKTTTDSYVAAREALNRIPLLVLLPQSETPVIAPVFGAQIDIAPTILHYLGIDPPRSFTGHALLPEDVGGLRPARWDGSFVSPPLMFDAGLDECHVLSDLRTLPPQACRALADKARKQLVESWFVTNNDLARRLVDHAEPLHPVTTPVKAGALGAACHDETECVAPGFDAHCLGGVCVTDPRGPCGHEGATAPWLPWAGACAKLGSDLEVCAASCDVAPCAGRCNEARACVPRQ